jgi:prepilin signal peptidase PulO-like enzyme (type II secretory pathway)
VVAARLTAEVRVAPAGRALALLAGCSGGGLLAVSAVGSGGDAVTVAVDAILATPILTTLLIDIRARLVFPTVLLPGLIAALIFSATGLLDVPLQESAIGGAGAAAATALLFALARWIWAGREESPLGSGDILIAATIGVMLGQDQTPTVLLAGMMLGAVAAGLLLLTHRARWEDPIPYGAFLCGSALVALAL